MNDLATKQNRRKLSAGINKPMLAQAFNRAAHSYHHHSQMQQGIAQRLLGLLNPNNNYQSVLDIGCGSGYSSRLLRARLPKAQLTAIDIAPAMLAVARQHQYSHDSHDSHDGNGSPDLVCADMEAMPFAEHSFDTIFSSSAMQWSHNDQQLISECHKILRPAGKIYLSTYGPGTLNELRSSWAKLDHYAHTIDFKDTTSLCAQLNNSGFDIELTHRQTEVVLYKDLWQLLKTLQQLGIKNCRRQRYAGLTTPRQLAQLSRYYQKDYAFRQSIRASYDIILIVAKKADDHRSIILW